MRTPDYKQLQAIHHTLGPALVLAGPGSGKTFTIIERIRYLIHQEKVPSGQILVVTFSKAAALEMQQRYQTEFSNSSCSDPVHFGTFHSLGFHILQDSHQFHGYSLVSEREKYHILELLLKNHGLKELCSWEKLSKLLDAFSRYKNGLDTGVDLDDAEFAEAQIFLLYQEYQGLLNEQHKMDFDDMILGCLQLFREQPFVLRRYQKLFSYILVDEFQDINHSQYEMIRCLAMPQNHLFVVGDDDQAIYGFRGSQPEIMRKFLEDYQDAKQYILSANYRSGEQIVRLAGEIIQKNRNRFPKDFQAKLSGGQISMAHLENRKEEEELLISHLRQFSLSAYDQAAIILRTNREVRHYRELCEQYQIPVSRQINEQPQIYDTFVARDLEAFLRYLYENHQRKDFLMFMNKPNRYLSRNALLQEQVLREDLICYYQQNEEMTKIIRNLFDKLLLAEKLSAELALRMFRKGLGYDQYLRETCKTISEFHYMMQIADRIEADFADYKRSMSLSCFLEEKGKHTEKRMANGRIPGVHILTMHTSKGLEFDQVYLPDLNEGIIPPKGFSQEKQIEEERRLLYVAVTRARKQVFLYETRERNREMTRFLKGLQLSRNSSNS